MGSNVHSLTVFTIITSYYVLSVVSCEEILLFEYYEYISRIFLVDWQP
jgi:hypothetical protein